MFGRRKPRRSEDDAEGMSIETRTAEPEGELRRLALCFRGRVQGVAFRWNSQICAGETGCTGWVRNELDGSVTMELQGTDEEISAWFGAFAKAYERFPINYRIAEREDIAPIPGETKFTVRN